jgi:hypothetical protein
LLFRKTETFWKNMSENEKTSRNGTVKADLVLGGDSSRADPNSKPLTLPVSATIPLSRDRHTSLHN